MKRWIDSLKQTRLIKSIVYFLVGIITYPGFAIINRVKIKGTEHLKNLPKRRMYYLLAIIKHILQM